MPLSWGHDLRCQSRSTMSKLSYTGTRPVQQDMLNTCPNADNSRKWPPGNCILIVESGKLSNGRQTGTDWVPKLYIQIKRHRRRHRTNVHEINSPASRRVQRGVPPFPKTLFNSPHLADAPRRSTISGPYTKYTFGMRFYATTTTRHGGLKRFVSHDGWRRKFNFHALLRGWWPVCPDWFAEWEGSVAGGASAEAANGIIDDNLRCFLRRYKLVFLQRVEGSDFNSNWVTYITLCVCVTIWISHSCGRFCICGPPSPKWDSKPQQTVN